MLGDEVKGQIKDLENVLIAALTAGVQMAVTKQAMQNFGSILENVPHTDQSAALFVL
jgi:hypothetical protein